MKIQKLIIKNIGIIANEVVEFNKSLILFYGEIKQGKSTYLNAVRWAMGGSFPSDIISHGQNEASIELVFDNGNISRTFYKNKEGEIVSRPQTIIIDNKPRQVKDLKTFLNPFLLNQNHLVDMTKKGERENYILELMSINTSDIDKQIFEKEKQATELRATIKGYGEITLTEVVKPELEKLEAEKAEINLAIDKERFGILSENSKLKSDWEAEKSKALQVISDFNSLQDSKQITIDNSKTMLNEIWAKVKGTIFEKCFDKENAKRLLETLPIPEAKKQLTVSIPEPTYQTVDESKLTAIEEKIQAAKVDQVKYDSYLKDKTRFDAKEKSQSELKTLETSIREFRKSKISKLSEINGKIEGVEVKDETIFFENTSFDMLSTSQLMTLSSKLSGLYPEGFGLELIDRGESLGKSIFTFVDKAKAENKTILATIVGERPANIPENIGVFVVENGELK